MRMLSTLGAALIAATIVTGTASGPVSGAPAPIPCGGIAGARCPQGDFCQIAPPQAPDKTGECRRRPQVCPDVYQPVCGTTGRTFSNACFAASAGVNVAHAGPCRSQVSSGLCSAVLRPVCGIDHKTYGNACVARTAGAKIAHAGPCAGDKGGITPMGSPQPR